jgi:hypothetical protein
MRRPPTHPPEPTYPCCLPALGEFSEIAPREGLRPTLPDPPPPNEFATTPPRLVLFAAEDSPSGLGRTLGKRVGGNPSRVRISYPPPVPHRARRRLAPPHPVGPIDVRSCSFSYSRPNQAARRLPSRRRNWPGSSAPPGCSGKVPCMGVSEKTCKIVWAEAGGRCAICRGEVITPGTHCDDPSVFGEEAHIVARSMGGPRAADLDDDSRPSHTNLLLLCSRHHKQIDDQPDPFRIERLREIKEQHAAWVRRSLDEKAADGPRLVPDPAFPQPRVLALITRGNPLWNMIKTSVTFEYALPDGLPDDDESLIVEVLDLLRDYLDIAPELHSVRENRDAEKSLGHYFRSLAEKDFSWAHMCATCFTSTVEATPWHGPCCGSRFSLLRMPSSRTRMVGPSPPSKTKSSSPKSKTSVGVHCRLERVSPNPDAFGPTHCRIGICGVSRRAASQPTAAAGRRPFRPCRRAPGW